MVWCTDAVSELAQLGGEGKGNSIMRLICMQLQFLSDNYICQCQLFTVCVHLTQVKSLLLLV